MKKFFIRTLQILLGLSVVLIAIGFFTDPVEQQSKQTQTEGTSATTNTNSDNKSSLKDGILVFNSVKDFFDFTNNFDLSDEVVINSENPLDLRITPFELSEDNILDEVNKENFIKNLYDIFIHTDNKTVTLEMYPVIVNSDRKITKSLNNLSIKGTVTRDKALSVLEKYTGIKDFNSLLVQKDELSEYGTLGYEKVKAFQEFITKNENAILSDLLEKQIKNTVVNKPKVANGVYDLQTVINRINKNLSNTSYNIPKNLKPIQSDNPNDVNDVATVQITKGMVLTIVINKETKKVNGINSIIAPRELGDNVLPALSANAAILSSLDASNSKAIFEKLVDSTVSAIEEFSTTQKTVTKKITQDDLNYFISLSTELGVVYSSVDYRIQR